MGIFHPQYLWQRLETLMMAQHRGGKAIGIQWVEARDAAKHPMTRRTVPHEKELPSLIMSRLEKPSSDRRGGWREREYEFNQS